MKKSLDNAAVFAVAYALCVLPTYFLPYLRDSSSLSMEALNGTEASGFGFTFLIYLVSLLALCIICIVRGGLIGKNWLVLLPVVAFAFEFIPKLSVIPYVPSMYHLLAIIVGAVSVNMAVGETRFTDTITNRVKGNNG